MAEISELDHFFLISVGTLVLLLQSGYAFLEAGAVRSKNAVNICLRYANHLAIQKYYVEEITEVLPFLSWIFFYFYYFSFYRSYSSWLLSSSLKFTQNYLVLSNLFNKKVLNPSSQIIFGKQFIYHRVQTELHTYVRVQ
jgi:ammonia channel protein AmtB